MCICVALHCFVTAYLLHQVTYDSVTWTVRLGLSDKAVAEDRLKALPELDLTVCGVNQSVYFKQSQQLSCWRAHTHSWSNHKVASSKHKSMQLHVALAICTPYLASPTGVSFTAGHDNACRQAYMSVLKFADSCLLCIVKAGLHCITLYQMT